MTMFFQTELKFFGSSFLWSIVTLLISTLLTTIVMRALLGLRFKKFIEEIVDQHNVGVAAFYFAIANGVSILGGAFGSEGFTESQHDWVWILFGLFLILFYGISLSLVVLKFLCHHCQKGERLITYIRREVVEEDNGALPILLASLWAIGFWPVLFQII